MLPGSDRGAYRPSKPQTRPKGASPPMTLPQIAAAPLERLKVSTALRPPHSDKRAAAHRRQWFSGFFSSVRKLEALDQDQPWQSYDLQRQRQFQRREERVAI